jgi:hypothetical protein
MQLSEDKPFLRGKRIGFQLRSKSRMALQEPSNDGFHVGWILLVPVAQPVKRTFLASIASKLKTSTHHIEEGFIYFLAGGINRFPSHWQQIPPHLTHSVEGVGPWFIEVRQMRGASQSQEVLKERKNGVDAALTFRPGHAWIEERQQVI